MRILSVVAAGIFLLTGIAAAQTAKPSVVARLTGDAPVVRASADGEWLAAWAGGASGVFTLYTIYSKNGDTRKVDETDRPGGLCWIPGTAELLYCKATYTEKTKSSQVRYFVYDTKTKQSKKIIDLTDMEQMYMFDPIAAEDGSKLIQVTIGGQYLPSINIFDPRSQTMVSQTARVGSFGAEYDVSSDGNTVYWYGHFENGNFGIVGYNIVDNYITELYEWPRSKDWADDHAMLRMNTPNNQAATIAYYEKMPTLQLCVYDYTNPKVIDIVPVYLSEGDALMYFEWKGRSETIYALVTTADKQTQVEEINALTGDRKVLVRTPDPISFIDYASGNGSYFFTTPDAKKASTTLIMRLQP